MLTNLKGNYRLHVEVERTLIMLDDSEFTFYLTGSRYFGKHTNESDYDFFAAYTIPVVNFLLNSEFMLINSGDYKDNQITQIYRYDNLPNIDIQLINDVNIKKAAHYIVNRDKISKNNDSLIRNSEWNRAYRVVKNILSIYKEKGDQYENLEHNKSSIIVG